MKKRRIIRRRSRQVITTRFGSWEQGVLRQLDDWPALQGLILRRQAEIDDDESQRDIVENYYRQRIVALRENPDRVNLFLVNPCAQQWLCRALDQRVSTNVATTKLEMLAISELRRGKHLQRRGWYWRGARARGPVTVVQGIDS